VVSSQPEALRHLEPIPHAKASDLLRRLDLGLVQADVLDLDGALTVDRGLGVFPVGSHEEIVLDR
jgi:hypothetical protein